MGGMSLSLLERVRRAGVPAAGVVGDAWMDYGPRVDGWLGRWPGFRRPAGVVAGRVLGIPAPAPLDQTARWLFISEHLRDQARAQRWDVSDSAVLSPGVDPARFPAVPPGPWRARLLYLGRLDRRKGVLSAVRALAELPDARLRIDGSGEPSVRAELERVASATGVAERIELALSPPGAVPHVLGQSDVVLFPVEWEEPWGLVPLEAMAVGRPLVATRSGGGAAEYLRDGVNCLLVEPGDAGGLAAAVRRLAADPELRARLVAAGRTTAARYPAQAFHAGLERELRALVARRS